LVFMRGSGENGTAKGVSISGKTSPVTLRGASGQTGMLNTPGCLDQKTADRRRRRRKRRNHHSMTIGGGGWGGRRRNYAPSAKKRILGENGRYDRKISTGCPKNLGGRRRDKPKWKPEETAKRSVSIAKELGRRGVGKNHKPSELEVLEGGWVEGSGDKTIEKPNAIVELLSCPGTPTYEEKSNSKNLG